MSFSESVTWPIFCVKSAHFWQDSYDRELRM
jgi:hypothetical protein